MQAAVASAGAVPIEGKNSFGARILYHFTNKDSRASMVMGFIGVAGFVFLWWLTTEKLKLPRFEKLPGPVMCWKEFVSRDPTFGTSMFTPQYYQHIKWSCLRILAGFTIATCLGVPLGLFMGWKKKVRDYAFPILELLRPIPTMAWVPLAILMFAGREAPIIFLACLSSFFATVLNTLLGVDSIDESYFRAAKCLGASEKDVFRRVVVPGALPFIFTGLQISMGVAWFSLVAAEMLSGEYGLGYLIWDSYVLSQYPVIVMGMVTLGVIGYICSALIRMVGHQLMRWTVR
jgi:NitT/TauT family transport system permease protein